MCAGHLVVLVWLLVVTSLLVQATQNTTQNTLNSTQNQNFTCTRTETVSVRVAVPLQEPATFRSYTWCLKVPPRCSKYTVIMRERIIYQTEVRNQTVQECCPGHVALYDTCIPQCATCDNMLCDKKKCSCKPGFVGTHCNQTCQTGKWGERCSEACVCRVGEDCDPVTGNCTPSTSTTSTTTVPTPTTTTTVQPSTTTRTVKLSTTTTTTTRRPTTTSSTNVFINLTPTEQSSSAEDLTEFNVIRAVDNDIASDDDYAVSPTDSAIVIERPDIGEANARWSALSTHSSVTVGSVLGLIALLVVIVSIIVKCRGKKQFDSASTIGDKSSLHLVAKNSHYAVPGPPPFSFLNGLPIDITREVCEDMYDHPRSIRCLNNEPVYDELRY
ncbi:integumentary mucin C.1-like [Macrosteles quadrilineatus]|uniref:integumentary mucin C.1-like n=1 Tax=Macrosteles quadrilineatus TaxID=74068 RepID=UPI0023E25D33|nr:integumentary mucin C.1-like [Macrosteles quadrilineatus]